MISLYFLFLYSPSGWSGAVEYNRGIDHFCFLYSTSGWSVAAALSSLNSPVWYMKHEWCRNNTYDSGAITILVTEKQNNSIWSMNDASTTWKKKAWSVYNAERPKIKTHLQMNWPLDLFSTSSHQSYSIFYLLSYCPCILLQ